MSNFYCFTDHIGGGAGALDARDGADLADKDAALVVIENNHYLYFLDADSALPEDSPFVISPDANAGNKRWILTDITAENTNAALSSMILTGGEISEGTNAGTIKVAALTAMLRTGTGAFDPLVRVSLAEQDNVTLAAVDIWYKVRLTYGSPCTIATSESSGNHANIIGIGHCIKEDDGTRHFSDAGLRLTDGVRKLHQRASSLREIEISSGGLVSDPDTRHLYVTAGIFYRGINRYTTSLFDSSSSGYDFEYYYWDPDGSAWIKDAGGPYTQIDNVQYNKVDSGSGLANLVANKYTANWVFLHPDDVHVLVLYGRSNTTLTAAENEEIPPSLPDILDEMAVLLCKVIIQQGSDTLIFENVKYFTFTPQIVVDHNELSGLQGGQAGEYYHLTSAEYGEVQGLSATYQPLDDVLTDLAALDVVADNEFIVGTGAGAYAHESGDTVRTSLGLVIGTDVQAHGDVLDDLNTLGEVGANSDFLVGTGAGVLAWENAATAKASIGLGNVENTQLSTWAGSGSITTLGTIATVGNITIADGGTIGNGVQLEFDDTNDLLKLTGGVAHFNVGVNQNILFKSYQNVNTIEIMDDTLLAYVPLRFFATSYKFYTGSMGIGVDAKTKLTVEGTMTLKERASADGDTATYGQIWVKNTDPCELWFTDDAGGDHQIAYVV